MGDFYGRAVKSQWMKLVEKTPCHFQIIVTYICEHVWLNIVKLSYMDGIIVCMDHHLDEEVMLNVT